MAALSARSVREDQEDQVVARLTDAASRPPVTEPERDLETVEMTINMGPQHPSTHGVFRLVRTLKGERVKALEPYIGYLHQGAEKLGDVDR